jgi:hypothetical protein
MADAGAEAGGSKKRPAEAQLTPESVAADTKARRVARGSSAPRRGRRLRSR